MSSERQLHLNTNILNAGKHEAAWRIQDDPRGIINIEYYRNIARIAERGTFDAVFLADGPALPGHAGHAAWNSLEPSVLLAAIGSATQHIGLIGTISTTFNDPYNVARRWSTLDHVTGGRAALNFVTSQNPGTAANFGLRELPSREERYARAEEFVDILVKLWDSWEDDALVASRETGVFTDTQRVHAIDYVSDRFSVRGPLNVPRTPQGRPVLVQAGDGGTQIAARFADAVFTAQTVFEESLSFSRSLKAAAGGRQIVVLPGLFPIVGSTEKEAWERKELLDSYLDLEDERVKLAAKIGLPPDSLELDKPLPYDLLESATGGSSRGFFKSTIALARAENLTVRGILARNPGAHRQIVGTPEQIADDIERWFVGGAADGFNLNADSFPTGLEPFVDHVVPLLRQRGIFRKEYTGTTLRDHLGLSVPESQYVGAAPWQPARDVGVGI
ncbi:FMN-dependent oxidoreductase (nitrilotriacetate monooxygenase family) [Actinoplanes tereljensis]|uniref:Monooxygenase n=1 Tax=Paractinoplanes tereljensis TaxID=571912 RepID=A0A919NWI2_9ACTN|nr:LLM class flavin-dependent oxidoreductase [Actinoplanes tereljensis]GIF26611.1 monooxygenase [Actinoplanes tereljensis]